MLTNEQLLACVEKHRKLILEAEKWLWAHPETGYREHQTHAWLAARFQELGYELREAGDIPGFMADIDTGRPGPKVLFFGEMDSLICNEHPDADPITHAVHACGHHAQCAGLLGLAAALKEPGALDGLSGSIRLCAVPAEELIETGYRETLRQQGIIKYFGGKVEFLRRGYFDDVDMAMMLHTTAGDDDFVITKGSNGCLVKNIAYRGRAVHASAPYGSINALYAANLGMQAINAIRETFRDEDHIRVHPIITAGGAAVNAIPSDVRMESYVRGATMEAIRKANVRVNRALASAAAAMGAGCTLQDRPGYAPRQDDPTLVSLFNQAFEVVSPGKVLVTDRWGMGCTDMGDISCVIPASQPYVGGAVGASHGCDYRIADAERACVNAAKAQLIMAHLLLKDDAAAARQVKATAKLPYSSIQAYLTEVDGLFLDADAVTYEGDTAAALNWGN